MNSYSLWVGLGATIGLWRVWHAAPQRQSQEWLNFGLFVLLAALAGARVFYVWLNWGFFSTTPLEAFFFWTGGLAWPGAIAGTAVSIIIFGLSYRTARGKRPAIVPLGLIGDRLYPLLAPLTVTIWIGCWQVGTAYGALLPDGAWWGLHMPDESGVTGVYFPLQPLAALILLLYFFALETWIKPLRPPGRLSALASGGLLLHLLAASLLTAEPAPIWNGLRVDTWFAIFYLAAFVVLVMINSLVVRIWKKQTIPAS